jgi:hypothetical protein
MRGVGVGVGDTAGAVVFVVVVVVVVVGVGTVMLFVLGQSRGRVRAGFIVGRPSERHSALSAQFD